MPGYAYGGPWDYERTKQIDRTRTGILLLLIGSLLSWIPYVGGIGSLILFVGAILVILGRKAFGPTHARNVVISIVLFCVGILVAIVVIFIAVFAAIAATIGSGGPSDIAALSSALTAALFGGIAIAVIVGIADVLFTYALQNQTGRILLWAAYGANVALSLAVFLIISPLVSSILTTADYDRVAAQQATLGLLSVIPAVIFAAADYLAWNRINRKEIPTPIPAPAMPMASPPPWNPPSPPASPPPSGPAPPMNP